MKHTGLYFSIVRDAWVKPDGQTCECADCQHAQTVAIEKWITQEMEYIKAIERAGRAFYKQNKTSS